MPYFKFSGKNIHYLQHGKGPLLLILPGNTASSRCHTEDLAYFSQDYTAVAIDYLGVGKSDRLNRFDTDWFRSCADQTAALIQHMGSGPALLIGTSGGAVVALQTAARHPDLIRAVVADSFTPILTPEMLQSNVIKDRAVRSDGQIAFWRYAHDEDWEKVIEADTAMLTSIVDSGGNWLDDALKETRCPVLITVSLEDQMLEKPLDYALEMLDELHDGRLFISPHGDHPLMWSKSNVFRQAAWGFLALSGDGEKQENCTET